MNHLKTIYDEIRCRYIQRYGKTGWFYKDYFENEKDGMLYFGESLKDNEGWLDQNKKPTETEIDTIWDNIKDGIFNSARIMYQVDQLTDKYYRDGNH